VSTLTEVFTGGPPDGLTDEERKMVDIANDIYVAGIQAELAKRYAPRPEWYLAIFNDQKTIIRCRDEYNTTNREIVIRCAGHEQFAARLLSWLSNHSIDPEQT
jgi:hypothetical protein